jgi:hypothetical protein
MPTTNHLHAFLDAMHSRNPDGTRDHVAEDVEILSPLSPEAYKGKEQVVELLKALLDNVDAFTMKQIVGGDKDYVAIFKIRAGSNEVDGMDHMHLNEEGLVDRMTVAWRPLQEVVGIQKKIAAAIGAPAVTLVLQE